jgi:hypothetical protein
VQEPSLQSSTVDEALFICFGQGVSSTCQRCAVATMTLGIGNCTVQRIVNA